MPATLGDARIKLEPQAGSQRSGSVMSTSEQPTSNTGGPGRELSHVSGGRSRGPARELIRFLAQNKKWWLAPIIGGLLVVGVVAGVTSSAVAPFLYTLF